MHDIAHAAADAARVPDFDDVLDRGRKLRARRQALAVSGAALAAAGILGLTQLWGTGDGGRQIEPAPPTPKPSVSDTAGQDSGPAGIIDDETSLIRDATLSADGRSTAVLWRLAGSGQGGREGLAVSDDGFTTRSVTGLPIPGDLIAAGDRFLLRDQTMSKLWVLGPDGARTRVTVEGPESPVADGEVAVSLGDRLVAVDPGAARAHPVGVPSVVWGVDAYGGRLSAMTTYTDGSGLTTGTYHWSDDGGASWQSAPFTSVGRWHASLVPSPAGSDHAIAISGGSGIYPLVSVLTMPAAGGTFTTTEYDGERATFAGAWTVDGEIRFVGDLWGDANTPRESGLYSWADGRLEPIPSSLPEATDADDTTLVDVVETPGGPALLLAVDDRLYSSPDGGTTWTEIAAR